MKKRVYRVYELLEKRKDDSYMEQRDMVFQRIKDVFEKPVACDTFYTDDERVSVEIISCPDSPFEGVTSYSTLGVWQCENLLTADDRALNVEFVGICDSRNNWFGGLLSTCAFAMIKGKVRAHPYEVYKNIIPVYQPNIDMKHILLIPPFSLNHDLGMIETEHRVITWLMLNPISENEFVYMQKNGAQKLIDAFVKENIDVYDLYRRSIF